MGDRRRPGLRVVVGELNDSIERAGGQPPMDIEAIIAGLDLDALARANPTCRTCTLHRRADLPGAREALLDLYRAHLSGEPYRGMQRSLERTASELGWGDFSIDHVSLHRHFTRHVPWEVAAARRTAERMAEARATEQAEAIAGAAMTMAEIAERARRKIAEFWIDPKTGVTSARESVDVARWVSEVEDRALSGGAQVELFERFVDLVRDLRAVLPAGQWDAFARRFWGRRGGPPAELRERIERELPPGPPLEDDAGPPPENPHLAAARRLAVRGSLTGREQEG